MIPFGGGTPKQKKRKPSFRPGGGIKKKKTTSTTMTPKQPTAKTTSISSPLPASELLQADMIATPQSSSHVAGATPSTLHSFSTNSTTPPKKPAFVLNHTKSLAATTPLSVGGSSIASSTALPPPSTSNKTSSSSLQHVKNNVNSIKRKSNMILPTRISFSAAPTAGTIQKPTRTKISVGASSSSAIAAGGNRIAIPTKQKNKIAIGATRGAVTKIGKPTNNNTNTKKISSPLSTQTKKRVSSSNDETTMEKKTSSTALVVRSKSPASSKSSKKTTSTNKPPTSPPTTTTVIPYAYLGKLDPKWNVPDAPEGMKTMKDYCTNFDKEAANLKRKNSLKKKKENAAAAATSGTADTTEPTAETIEPPPNRKTTRQEEEEEIIEKDDAGPTVEIINGEIVIKDSSLQVGGRRTVEDVDRELQNSGVIVEDSELLTATYNSFKKKDKSTAWTVEETKLFYKALRQCGSDFSTMTIFFENTTKRTRQQIKRKYLIEVRKNPKLIDLALNPTTQKRLGMCIVCVCV